MSTYRYDSDYPYGAPGDPYGTYSGVSPLVLVAPALARDDCTVFVRDANGNRAAIIDEFAEGLSATVRANDVGVLLLDIPARLADPDTGQLGVNPLLPVLNAGNVGVEIVRNSDDRVLWGGPMFEPVRKRDADNNLLSVAVHDDIEWLNRRLTHPWAPDGLAPGGQDDIRAVYSVPPVGGGSIVPSTAILNLVSDNLGPTAETARQVPGFALAVDPLYGDLYGPTAPTADPAIEFGWNTGMVLTAVQMLATRFGLIFAMIDGEFTVRQGIDRSATVVFEFEETEPPGTGYSSDGSLISYEHRKGVPTANAVFIVTDVDGSNVFRDLWQTQDDDDVDAWGRVEGFYDDDARPRGTSQAIMEVDGANFLADKLSVEAASMETREGPVYGVHYELGDLVTARLDETDYLGQVIEVKITADSHGWRIQPVLGSPGRPLLLAPVGDDPPAVDMQAFTAVVNQTRVLNEDNRTFFNVAELARRIFRLGG